MLKIIQKPVPHYRSGREGRQIEAVIIHIGEGNQNQIFGKADKVDEKSFGAFMNEEKSSHYSVDADGAVWQFVQEKDTAWHCGIVVQPTSWLIRTKGGINPNLYTIGIEHAGWGNQDITEIRYRTTAELLKDICYRYNIKIDRDHIIGHREIRNDKTCPGKIDIDKIIRMAEELKNPKIILATTYTSEYNKLQTQFTLLEKLVELWKKLNE